jgi:hypothetical protein
MRHLSTALTDEGIAIDIEMPFDGKASIVLLDKEDNIKEVLLNQKILPEGKTRLKLNEIIDWNKRTMVLITDGQIAGVLKQMAH